MSESYFKSFDGKELFLRSYEDAEKPKAMLLVIHGMSESSKRYNHFAKFLSDSGILVYAPDLRSHGYTAVTVDLIGKTGDGDLFQNSVQDIVTLTDYLKEKYKNLPLFVLGHSYGSFLTQSYITQNSGAKGVILSGSSYFKTPLNSIAKIIAKTGMVCKGKDAKAKLIKKMSFDNYGKLFSDGSWLSRDPEVMNSYKADPFNAQTFSMGFYYYFFYNAVKMYSKTAASGIDKETPLLIMSGSKDPVGNMSKGTTRLYDFYKGIGVKNVTFKLYEGGRHESINETNKEEVYKDILTFIVKNC